MSLLRFRIYTTPKDLLTTAGAEWEGNRFVIAGIAVTVSWQKQDYRCQKTGTGLIRHTGNGLNGVTKEELIYGNLTTVPPGKQEVLIVSGQE